MIEKKLSNATPLDDENVVLRRSDNNFLNKTQITNCILSAPNSVATCSGNTITVKQGLEGLSANGNNPDGTINNVSVSIDNDISKDISSFGNRRHKLIIVADKGENNWSVGGRVLSSQWFEQETQPEGADWTWYNIKTREWKTCDSGVIQDVNVIPLGIFSKTNSGITEFYTDQPINLLKQSDKSIISGWGMPSNKYIDLTLGASISTYTAPANGWFYFAKVSGIINAYIELQNISVRDNFGTQCRANSTTGILYVCLPAKKGDTVRCSYSATGKTTSFGFAYAEGEM